jgi:hypothetical protein
MYLQNRLSAALRALGECCHPPLRKATWPSDAQLDGLHFAVMDLAMMERKKPITAQTPYWTAYKRVDKRHSEIRLIPRVKELVGRADRLLKEVGDSDLVRLRRKVATGVSEAKRLAKNLEALEEGLSKVGKIEWENYEGLLFCGSDNKPVQLQCGDLPASSRMRCYARALEILTDHLREWPLRNQALPLLIWINCIGSPYAELLNHDYQSQYCADYLATRLSEASTARKREQWRKRQKKHRDKKLRAELLAKRHEQS